MDQCGFPKDLYYYYQAWWSNRPVLHLFPHWNWHHGEEIDVRCFTNCDEVELFLNGQSQGCQPVVRNSHCAWKIRFERGTLEARGYRRGKRVLTTKRQTTGAPALIALEADRPAITADGQDLASVTVSVLDRAGLPVPTADNLIEFDVKGAGRLLGVGNGDPSSHESDKAPARTLFNGLALALVQSTQKPGEITLTARAKGLAEATLRLRSKS
jgi:beta-galactosidase